MIGRVQRRSVLASVLAVTLPLILFVPRSADPALADPPRQAGRVMALDDAAQRAVEELDGLAAVVAAAVAEARQGSARIVSGDDPPEPPLEAAAAVLAGGVGELRAAQTAVASLAGTLASVRPGQALPSLSVSEADLLGIADQLRAAAEAATPFVARRRAAAATLEELGRGLAALEANDPAAAQAAIERAATAREEVAGWEEPPAALIVWLNTTDAMLSAVRDIAEAVAAGDAEAASVASEAYAQAAEQAGGADRALALSIAEAGSALTQTPMRRLAAISAELEALRAAATSV